MASTRAFLRSSRSCLSPTQTGSVIVCQTMELLIKLRHLLPPHWVPNVPHWAKIKCRIDQLSIYPYFPAFFTTMYFKVSNRLHALLMTSIVMLQCGPQSKRIIVKCSSIEALHDLAVWLHTALPLSQERSVFLLLVSHCVLIKQTFPLMFLISSHLLQLRHSCLFYASWHPPPPRPCFPYFSWMAPSVLFFFPPTLYCRQWIKIVRIT